MARSKSADDRSTATAAQYVRILEALRSGDKTSHDLRCLGIYQAPTRIKELVDRYGYNIRTERVTLWDRDGYAHHGCARYSLLSQPAPDFKPAPDSGEAHVLAEAAKSLRAWSRALLKGGADLSHLPTAKDGLEAALRILSERSKQGGG